MLVGADRRRISSMESTMDTTLITKERRKVIICVASDLLLLLFPSCLLLFCGSFYLELKTVVLNQFASNME